MPNCKVREVRTALVYSREQYVTHWLVKLSCGHE